MTFLIYGISFSDKSIKLTYAAVWPTEVGENEGETDKGETRLFQSNNLSYADINYPATPARGVWQVVPIAVCVASVSEHGIFIFG